MSASSTLPAPSREPPYDEVTVDGMLAFMKYSREANPDQDPDSPPKRLRWSRQRSAAVLLATMFNGMRLRDPDEEEDQPKGTVFADMVPCFDDIFVEYSSTSDMGNMTLVAFGLPDEHPPTRFPLTSVSPTRWEYEGLIQLPKSIPDLILVLESEFLGDVGCVSLTNSELEEAKSAPRANEDDPAAIVRPFRNEDCAPQDGSTPKITMCITSVMTERTQCVTEQPKVTPAPQKDSELNKPLTLAYQGQALQSQFEVTDRQTYLDEAIELFSEALALVPSIDTDKPQGEHYSALCVKIYLLEKHGHALSERFSRFGNIADIALAIKILEEALRLSSTTEAIPNTSLPNGFPPLPSLLATAKQYLGIAFVRRYDTSGAVEDLERAVKLQREESESVPPNSKVFAWGRLGTYLLRRFGRFASLPDIDEAVECQRRSLEGFMANGGLEGEPITLAQRYSDLGTPLLQRFKANGDLGDVDEAILCFKEAASLVSSGSTADEPAIRVLEIFNGLAMALMRRFERTRDLNDINEAISAQQRALNSAPLDFPDRHTVLNNLALCFQRHYEHTKDADSLHETVEALRQAIDVTPQGHPMLALTLNNFATALMGLSEVANPAENTKQAIDAQTRAIELTPAGHPSLPAFYDNLGHWYRNLFSATSDSRAIQSAIGAQRKSLSLSTTTHPEHSLILASLATSLLTRHELTSDLGDLQEAISMLEDSLGLTPAGHSHISDRQRNLARAYYRLYSITRDVTLMNRAFTLYSLAASSTTTPARSRLNAAMEWERHARLAKSNSQTFEAMETAMKLVAFVAGMEQSLERRYDNLSELSMLVLASAAFAASQLQRPDKALEWLEQGRGLVWRQLSGLRTPLEDLQAKNPRLAEQLQSLSAELEQVSSASSSRTSTGLAFDGSALQARISSHNQAAQQVKVATEREKVLQTIRTTLPGFESFLQTPPTHEILRHLPTDGPVIVLGAHPTGCYALALLADLGEPMYIPLSFTWDRALELGSVLASNLARYGVRAHGASTAVVPEPTEVEVVDSGSEPQDEVTRAIRRYTRDTSSPRNGVSFVLRELWLEVVKPILDSLTLLKTTSNQEAIRIWWCPTGPLTSLPIHAAGIYTGSDAICLADYAVSSYIPTIAVLAERMKNARAPRSGQPNTTTAGLLIVSQPNTPGCTPIPGTTVEADHVSHKLQLPGIPSLWLDGDKATVEAGLRGMQNFRCIHLACHATQRQDRPLQSGFYLHDGRLELTTIMKSKLKHADLAFLSACQTSAGSSVVPEEAVHLAAGMLSAGYRGVVATMWSIQDEYAPQVAGDFYHYLLESNKASVEGHSDADMDGSMAAYALQDATGRLRERLDGSDISFLAWVPYVHFGL